MVLFFARLRLYLPMCILYFVVSLLDISVVRCLRKLPLITDQHCRGLSRQTLLGDGLGLASADYGPGPEAVAAFHWPVPIQ